MYGEQSQLNSTVRVSCFTAEVSNRFGANIDYSVIFIYLEIEHFLGQLRIS